MFPMVRQISESDGDSKFANNGYAALKIARAIGEWACVKDQLAEGKSRGRESTLLLDKCRGCDRHSRLPLKINLFPSLLLAMRGQTF